ncbi:hypothetical protein J7J62_08660 [bacterium]|nr:hypothetical protein [bacterium]
MNRRQIIFLMALAIFAINLFAQVNPRSVVGARIKEDKPARIKDPKIPPIIPENASVETLFTVDGQIMGLDKNRIAIDERYYRLKRKGLVVYDKKGKLIPYGELKEGQNVRVRLRRKGKKIFVEAIMILPEEEKR